MLQIVGRTSSLYTRIPLVFAHELGVPFALVPIHDMLQTEADAFGGNPALKLPTLRRDGGGVLFGAENICRAMADVAPRARRIVWPEMLHDDLSRNAQEMVRHAMAAQIQLIVGTMLGKLPPDNVYFVKGRAGFEGALRWLDEHLSRALAALPADRDLSFFEVTLLCLIDHLAFRQTLSVEPYQALAAFGRTYGARPSAQKTVYAFDAPPTGQQA